MSTKSSHIARPNRKGVYRLLTWREIEPWQQDNEYILTGYRSAISSTSACLKSVFELHNETTNIWTHLLGAFLFISYIHTALSPSQYFFPGSSALIVFHSSVILCFLLSTLFHLFSSHSAPIHSLGHSLDHLGIVLVFLGTGLSTAQVAFLCTPALRTFYTLLLIFAAGLAGLATLRPAFRVPAARPLRLAVYVVLGLSLFLPGVHAVASLGWQEANRRAGLASFAGLAVVNFTGAAIYALRVPERWTGGATDLLGQSHNWMHVFVVAGAVIRGWGLKEAVEDWSVRRIGVVCADGRP
ncbi:adiponectin receptor protein 1 [Myriangium duriaei CBS 260.36]|uniref:Adiponectin receptor protein 1 n=1 Tax=Myriangium duriaei CBS 260.36 TaxID=1168546 RepID=A0A9P4IX80_9PEZI|nr:adiponectin receptor protein 1 [Myriangium duriaei CBS 260.36]